MSYSGWAGNRVGLGGLTGLLGLVGLGRGCLVVVNDGLGLLVEGFTVVVVVVVVWVFTGFFNGLLCPYSDWSCSI